MRIQRVTVSGFRSFGPIPVRIRLAQRLTVFVGANASGKTALLQALATVFGVTRAMRTLSKSDFHLPPDTAPDDRSTRDLFVDVRIVFPELSDGSASSEAVAPVFRHMIKTTAGGQMMCRIRMEARWEDDGTVEGAITQNTYWVDSLKRNPVDEEKHPFTGSDHGLIQLYYTPASRDAASQVKATSGALASRILRAIDWSKSTRSKVEDASKELTEAFEGEAAIAAIGDVLSSCWDDLHGEKIDTKPGLSLVSTRFEEIVSRVSVLFEQGPAQVERGLESLSDGQQSLFYFALAAAVFRLESDIAAGDIPGFISDELKIPALTIFASEEPENHLSPFYLSRILDQIRALLTGGRAQAILTSHSPAVLGRVKPREVRYCRKDPKLRTTSVKTIEIPSDDEQAAKFVRGAMQAYPELYFARHVVFVEGDSERIVLPKIAEGLGLRLDPSFVAVVPLSGRHVEHFWNLLSQLKIPFVTLLDLDLGRTGGGYGRIKTAIKQLIMAGYDRDELLAISTGVLTEERFETMHTWQTTEHLAGWIKQLRSYGVFFSDPLDFDMLMLEAFPAAYASLIPPTGGPRLSVDQAAVSVLQNAGNGASLYDDVPEIKEAMPAYVYHFLSQSKPATHLRALTGLKKRTIAEDVPKVLKKLLTVVSRNLALD